MTTRLQKFKRQFLPYFLVGMVIFGTVVLLGGVKAMQIQALIASGASFPEPSEAIAARPVLIDDWEQTIRAVGTVRAERGVVVATEVAGIVREIAFVPGQQVNAGDVLVRLDDSIELADLDSAKAASDLASISLDRIRLLRESNSIAQSELDAAKATHRQALARQRALEASIGKKTIRAPFDGYLGLRLINLGEFLSPGTGIVSLQSLGTVEIDFSIPQNQFSRLQIGLPLRVSLENGAGAISRTGQLMAINPDFDRLTRMVRAQGLISNEDLLLRPGMFVQIEIILPTAERVMAVPLTAIRHAPYGNSVFRLMPRESDGALIASQVFVRLGRSRGDFVSILEGLEPSDLIATDGVFKLRSGLKVRVENDRAPQPSLAPDLPNA